MPQLLAGVCQSARWSCLHAKQLTCSCLPGDVTTVVAIVLLHGLPARPVRFCDSPGCRQGALLRLSCRLAGPRTSLALAASQAACQCAHELAVQADTSQGVCQRMLTR